MVKFKKGNIPKNKRIDIDRDYLFNKYYKLNMPVTEIAKGLNCDRRSIYRYLKHFNIKRKGSKKALTGRKLSMEHKYKCIIKLYEEGRIGNHDTDIERQVENYLLFNGVLYVKQYHYGYGIADFWLPEYNMVIECDGDYWHSLPGRKEKDEIQTKWLEKNDFIVYRFTGSNIKNTNGFCVTVCFK